MSQPEEFTDELTIEAGRASAHYWRDLWQYQELLGFLAWRDIKVRYKQSVLGIAWAVIQPLVTLVVFTFVFGRLAGMPSGAVPYPLLVLAGLLPWQLFASAFSNASGSLASNSHLISKVYFPRLIVPLSSIAVALLDFVVVLALFAVLCTWEQFLPDLRVLALPLFVLLAVVAAAGAGLWMTALTVKYRDFRYIVPFLLQVGLFISPVGYSSTNLPNWKLLLAFNPLVGVIDGFRWSLLRGQSPLEPASLALSIGSAVALLGSGVWYFRRVERHFADAI